MTEIDFNEVLGNMFIHGNDFRQVIIREACCNEHIIYQSDFGPICVPKELVTKCNLTIL